MAYHNDDAILDIHDRPAFGHWLGLSIQHLFAMFGSTVLVPILVGLDPSIALFSSALHLDHPREDPGLHGVQFFFHHGDASVDERRWVSGHCPRHHRRWVCVLDRCNDRELRRFRVDRQSLTADRGGADRHGHRLIFGWHCRH